MFTFQEDFLINMNGTCFEIFTCEKSVALLWVRRSQFARRKFRFCVSSEWSLTSSSSSWSSSLFISSIHSLLANCLLMVVLRWGRGGRAGIERYCWDDREVRTSLIAVWTDSTEIIFLWSSHLFTKKLYETPLFQFSLIRKLKEIQKFKK